MGTDSPGHAAITRKGSGAAIGGIILGVFGVLAWQGTSKMVDEEQQMH